MNLPMIKKHPAGTPGSKISSYVNGIGFCLLLTIVAFGLARLPMLERIGPLGAALVLAIVYRYKFGTASFGEKGIRFASHYMLRWAIMLYGFKLNLLVLWKHGVGLLLVDSLIVATAIIGMIVLGKLRRTDQQLSLLLGAGAGICGAAAIAAVSSILKPKEEFTILSIGAIVITGTCFAFGYSLLLPFLPLSDVQYGIWTGFSLHELAHVAMAAAPAGEEAVTYAIMAKLGRVLLLIPVCLLIAHRLPSADASRSAGKLPYPWFLLGFAAFSVLGTVLSYFHAGGILILLLEPLAGLLLCMSMIGLGLKVHFKQMNLQCIKPLTSLLLISIVISFLSFLGALWI
ncbi:YeiH family protein [Marinicrinis lubricantis]|uniref:YeiH family protein n=1 Tax=Marinicrinis lubricantis TaxID=2086470 RepID=A0ABW1IV92_9BACL